MAQNFQNIFSFSGMNFWDFLKKFEFAVILQKIGEIYFF